MWWVDQSDLLEGDISLPKSSFTLSWQPFICADTPNILNVTYTLQLISIDNGDDGDVSIKIYFYQKVGRVPGTTQPVSHQQMDEHIGPGGGVTELNFDDHELANSCE